MSTLETAIALAAAAHAGQTDKAGQPYILHPLRVMLCMQTNAERMVAVLHDVVEDTPLTLADL
jgi:GTP diphosphokinase / guanosine-3',5'-bis(diphosphate) 3'-diphosphatase